MIEKHVTLRRADGGPDSAFSLEPHEMAALVRDVRSAWSSLGNASYERQPSELGSVVFRRSVYAVRDLVAGEPFTHDNIRIIRPGYGLAPKYFDALLARKASRAIARGTALTWLMVSD
jgi:N-acetylneuraminate synthase